MIGQSSGLFIKVTRSGPRQYVQLVEAYRDDSGRPKQRTVATLGRLDQMDGSLESVISGLLRVTGQPAVSPATATAPAAIPALSGASVAPVVHFESARDFGDVWVLTQLWNSLGFDRLRTLFRRTRHTIDVEALVRVMVLNRLCDPDSKLGVLRWLETVSLPGILCESVPHQRELFSYGIDERALAHARLMDGKLLVVTNVADLAPEEVVRRYKSLADIERGLSGAEVGNRDRPDLPPAAQAHPGACGHMRQSASWR